MNQSQPDLATRMLFGALVLLLCLGSSGCLASSQDPAQGARPSLEEARTLAGIVLDDWHQAASVANADRYMGHFTQGARFLGTAAEERWDRAAFAEYVQHYFVGEGRGWTYLPRDRHVSVSQGGNLAWFDELLDNTGYGELRGSGVLQWEENTWRIAQYSMTFTVPNGVAREVVARIRAFDSEGGGS